MNKSVKLLIASMTILLLIIFFTWYCYDNYYYPSTSDAYINANTVQIAASVTGIVQSVNVIENQSVKKGQILFIIDPVPFHYAVQQARAQVALALQQAQADADAVNVAAALVAEKQANLVNAQINYDRNMPLVLSGNLPFSQGDQVTADLATAHATLISAEKQIAQARSILGQPGIHNANVRVAKANLAAALYQLKQTVVRAPADGTVIQLTLRKGSTAEANIALFAFIENNEWWVDANFKENNLERLRVGQLVTIKMDMYPHHIFQGTVQSVSRGSGSAFSLLPPENATGNWVKVTQRFTVRIALLEPNPTTPWRVGASAYVRVNTHE